MVGWTRRKLLLGAALPFAFPEGDRLRLSNRALGWTVLRDREARPEAAETGMVLARVQRPVAPADRPGHLAASLRHFRPFRFGSLPAEAVVQLAGLPGRAIEAPAMGIGSRVPVMVHAVCLFAPRRSYLIIGSAPGVEWEALRPELLRVIEGFRPG
ncbi:hypothetical protein ACFQY5_24930 [Paeniroseomonas aquatica]|uniref:Uncharacterized protein n=1 Tax=Paeniroseomonas aquatica TaxID=373043 RepID=A0ABT8AA27_9PROT|nr:hypothetical protein [Paeniroseomonas aquatica]MDN3566281.1 hypothetical protein [Paeniroseomonas aquatica]